MVTSNFDPTAYGATPVQSSGSFNPASYGATPITKSNLTSAPVTNTQSTSDSIWGSLASNVKNAGHNIIGAIGNALTSSEQSFGSDIAAAATTVLPKSVTGQDQLDQANQAHQDAVNTAIKGLHQAQQTGGDTQKWLGIIGQITGQSVTSTADLYPALKKSNLQVLGDAGGVLLDVLSAGSYGEAAKGAQTGELLAKTEKVAQPVVKQTLGQIGKETLQRSAIGAGTGYAYDVASNLQSGKTGGAALMPGMGTLTGGAIPLVIGGVKAGIALTKETAPRFINSLIKPKQADFSYGKDPGRTVADLGITGNSLTDFQQNIDLHKADIGTRIGEVYSNPANADIKINVQDEIDKIDAAIADAAKGGKNNQGVVTALQNTKDALLYEHGVNADGVIEKVGTTPRDLTALSPQEVFNLKDEVASHTKFNGTPSDDKAVNSVLKDIYGGLKEKLNTAVGPNNPEIMELNQKYADLTSASLAVKNRDAILRRSDLISMPIKVGTVAGILTSIGTGGAGIPAVLASVGAGTLDKALASTAVKTRIAAWLGSAEPSAITRIIQANPGIKETIYRLAPKLGSGK